MIGTHAFRSRRQAGEECMGQARTHAQTDNPKTHIIKPGSICLIGGGRHKKIKVKGGLVQKLKWKPTDGHDRSLYVAG